MRKIIRLASRAPAIVQPSPMPAAAPGATFGLFCVGMELAVLKVELIENVVKLVELIAFVGELVEVNKLDKEFAAPLTQRLAEQAANPPPPTGHSRTQSPQLKGSTEKS
jgi:hypothetical protein